MAQVMAPMVEQSDLPYRLLAREYGAGLCYSPMIHSRYYADGSATARSRMFETSPEDRPLVVSAVLFACIFAYILCCISRREAYKCS